MSLIKLTSASFYLQTETQKVLLVSLTRHDKKFPLYSSFSKNALRKLNGGVNIEDFDEDELSPKAKNLLYDFIITAIDHSFVADILKIEEEEEFLIIAFKLSELEKIIEIKKTFLASFPRHTTIIGIFIPIEEIKSSFFESIFKYLNDSKHFSLVDIVKFVGIKKLAFLMLSPFLLHLIVPKDFVENTINFFNGTHQIHFQNEKK